MCGPFSRQNTDLCHFGLSLSFSIYLSVAMSPIFRAFILFHFQVGLINHGKEDFGAEIAKTLSSEITIALRAKTNDPVDTNNSDDDSESVPKSVIADAPNRATKIIDFSMSLFKNPFPVFALYLSHDSFQLFYVAKCQIAFVY